MLSILIPTYNYNAFVLAETIEKQALALNLSFEIICADDGSFSNINIENQKINSLTNSKFIERKKNLGSILNRVELAKLAQYDHILFIDADTLPKNNLFLKNYLDIITKQYEFVFGGFTYANNISTSKSLRYNFGKKREEVSSKKRNKTPYKIIISANFLANRLSFINLTDSINANSYGLDYLLSSKLKESNNKVYHIDNEVFHLGIDTNDVYLSKVNKAVDTLYNMHQSGIIKNHSISLLKAYSWLKIIGVYKIFGKITSKFNKQIKSNLMSPSPSLFLFDIYRLGHFCRLSSRA